MKPAAPNRPPTREQVQRLQRAAGLLAQGKPADALAEARALAIELPGVGKVQHLLALTLKADGQLDAARRAFETALSLDPQDPQLAANHANLLVALGETEAAIARYRAALALDPGNAEAWINLSVSLLRSGDIAGALDAAQRATTASPQWPAGWHALGAAQRAAGDIEGAAASLGTAVSLDPDNPPLRLALGVAERIRGRPAAALGHYEVAERMGMRTPEILDARASALLDVGDTEAAIALARTLCARHPEYAAGHIMLAEMLWEHGDAPEAALEGLVRAAAARPADRTLQFGAAQLFLAARRPQAAIIVIDDLRRRQDSAQLTALAAEAHRQAGDIVGALERLADAPEDWRRDVVWRRAQVRVLLAARRPEHAAKAAEETLAWAGYDQELLALIATAWRMSGDLRERWLCNHEGLVQTVDIDVASWIDELRGHLLGLHGARHEPLRQSLRNGSQTAGNLLGSEAPVVQRLHKALQEAITEVLSRLPKDATHPFLCRNTGRARFVGSWSAKLLANGRHADHFHQQGWLSSAFYVQLPPSMGADAKDDAGCLQFGQPDEDLGLTGLAPQWMVRPKVGRLALFPSYFWHGTVPFFDATPRLTVAFDAQPA